MINQPDQMRGNLIIDTVVSFILFSLKSLSRFWRCC